VSLLTADVGRSRGSGLPARTGSVATGAALGLGTGLVIGLVLAAVSLRVGILGPVALVVLPLAGAVAWRRPDLVLVAAVLALPVGHVVIGPVELVQLGTAAAVTAVLVPAAARLAWRLPPWPVTAPLVGFLVVSALATPGAADLGLAIRLDVQLLLLVLLTVAATTALRTPAHAHRAVVALVVAGGVASVSAVLGAGPTESYYGGSVVTGRAVGVFAQPNELGLFSALLLVVAVGVGLTATTTRLRLVCLASGALLLSALALSLSRGAWLGALVGLVALAVLVPRARRGLAVLGGLAVLAGVVLGALDVGPLGDLGARVASVSESGSDPYDQRPLIWSEALRLFADAPVLGHGPGGFTEVAASDALRVGAFLDVDHAHHLLLNVAVEFGTAGLLALLGLVVGLVTMVRRAAGSSLTAVLAAALVVVVAHGLLDYPLRNPTAVTTVWLVLSLLVVAACARTEPDGEDPQE
jgi:putative inorganic carbon (HCO3(-)) transporter